MKFKNQRTAVIIFCALGNCVQSKCAHCAEMQFHCNIWLLLFLCILISNASIHRLTLISVMQLQELCHKEASVSLMFSVLIFNKQLLLQSICSNHHSFALVFYDAQEREPFIGRIGKHKPSASSGHSAVLHSGPACSRPPVCVFEGGWVQMCVLKRHIPQAELENW